MRVHQCGRFICTVFIPCSSYICKSLGCVYVTPVSAMDLVVQALMRAVRKRSMKDIKQIIDGGIGPINEYISTSDDKPLYVAVVVKDIAIVKYLVDSGIQVTNDHKMWNCVLENHISTEIFKIIFSQLKSEIVAKNGGPEGVNEAVFTFLQDARDQNKSSPRFLIEYAGIHSSV